MKGNRKFLWWNWLLPLVIVGIGLIGLLLVQDATDAILESADGDFAEVVLDPLAPGFESYVTSTPTHLLGIKGPGNELISLVLLSLFAGDKGGTAIVFPVDLIIGENESIGDIYSAVSEAEFLSELGGYLQLGFNGTSFLDEEAIDDYFGVAGPLTVILNDPLLELTDGEPKVIYESGELSLASSRVFDFLSWESEEESSYNRWLRYKNFWESWLGSISGDETETLQSIWQGKDLNRMFKGISSGSFIIQGLSLSESEDSDTYLQVEDEFLSSVLLNIVPFPISPYENGRAKIKLIDGVGGVDLVNAFVPELVAAGAEIKLLGNAQEFGIRESVITYYDKNFLNFAEAFGKVIDASAIEFQPLSESAVDVTVLIGSNSLQ